MDNLTSKNQSYTTSDDFDQCLIFSLKRSKIYRGQKVMKLADRFSMKLKLKMVVVCLACQRAPVERSETQSSSIKRLIFAQELKKPAARPLCLIITRVLIGKHMIEVMHQKTRFIVLERFCESLSRQDPTLQGLRS